MIFTAATSSSSSRCWSTSTGGTTDGCTARSGCDHPSRLRPSTTVTTGRLRRPVPNEPSPHQTQGASTRLRGHSGPRVRSAPIVAERLGRRWATRPGRTTRWSEPAGRCLEMAGSRSNGIEEGGDVAASSAGSSAGAKCPPRGISVQRRRRTAARPTRAAAALGDELVGEQRERRWAHATRSPGLRSWRCQRLS